jgi:allantoate deiminase
VNVEHDVSESPLSFDPAVVWSRIESLARHGKHGETGVARAVYTPEWRAAVDEVMGWCESVGLDVRLDAVGNVWGVLKGADSNRKSIVTGSHIDSQLPGGRFDGILGVIGGVFALGALKERYGNPRQTLEVLAFCEEESSRFPNTGFWGSRAITGLTTPEDLTSVISFTGEPIGEVMMSAGFDPALIPTAKRDDIESFVEFHIEQGPLLEAEGLPIGVVSAITGIRHYVVTVDGTSNHAGAFPMDLRRDPMAGAAEMISNVIDRAKTWGRPAVTTVGRIFVEPNFPAIVPERVTFMIDARHPDPAKRLELYAAHEAAIHEIAERRNLGASVVNWMEHAPFICDPALVANFEQAARSVGAPFQTMTSGAVHDTQQMGRIADGVMLFVRSKDGRSHTPAEYTSPEDAALGIGVLTEGLRTLAY